MQSDPSFPASLPGATTGPAPAVTPYLPGRNALGHAILIFPGGGYGRLAPHEGHDYAVHFAAKGVHAFVVEYRLGTNGHRHPAMLEDAAAAVHTIRGKADSYGFSKERIGVLGSSAGGHLAASLMTLHTHFPEARARPDFGILCYPVISLCEKCVHEGSARNLLGESPDPGLREELSCERQVTASTPPAFLWHSYEDAAVPAENSLLYATALRRHGVPAELHIVAKGRHGLGLATGFDWPGESLRFLQELYGPEDSAPDTR